jgi:hypothetical protein
LGLAGREVNMRCLRKYFNADVAKIREILGPPDDGEYYSQDLKGGLDDEKILRMLHNAQVKTGKEIAHMQSLGILDAKGKLIDKTLPLDMQEGSKCEI